VNKAVFKMNLLNRGDFVKIVFAITKDHVIHMVVWNGNSFVLMGDAKRLAMRDASRVAKETAIGPNAQIKKKYAQEKI
jgi:hypothetical protein